VGGTEYPRTKGGSLIKFEGPKGMIAGFFTYQQFPRGAECDIHDEIEVEIVTTKFNDRVGEYSVRGFCAQRRTG
jgi:hypothetical protein